MTWTEHKSLRHSAIFSSGSRASTSAVPERNQKDLHYLNINTIINYYQGNLHSNSLHEPDTAVLLGIFKHLGAQIANNTKHDNNMLVEWLDIPQYMVKIKC